MNLLKKMAKSNGIIADHWKSLEHYKDQIKKNIA